MSQFPQGCAHDGDKYQASCPIYDSEFLVGYISEFKKVEPIGETTDAGAGPQPAGSSYGAAGGLSTRPSPSDQRSNTLNPNNLAHNAAADKRSTQMNPNKPAYRSSRR